MLNRCYLNPYVTADAKTPSSDRLRPNKWTATALLARVYLYKNDWPNAEAKATLLINNKALYDTVPLNSVFLKNSKEAIWQLQPVNVGWNTEEARVFVLPSSGPSGSSPVDGYPVYLSDFFRNAFESGDKRKVNWINNVTINGSTGMMTYYYPFKYKVASVNSPVTEYSMVFRLAEQYLIRAEARAQQSNISGAQNDLNVLRARAGLQGTSASSKSALIEAAFNERRFELFTEWGHRWLDLKRTGKVDEVMQYVAGLKGTSWNTNWKWYPISQYDRIQNPNLGQNTGY